MHYIWLNRWLAELGRLGLGFLLFRQHHLIGEGHKTAIPLTNIGSGYTKLMEPRRRHVLCLLARVPFVPHPTTLDAENGVF